MFALQRTDVCGDKNASYDLITTEHSHETSHYTLYICVIMCQLKIEFKNKL